MVIVLDSKGTRGLITVPDEYQRDEYHRKKFKCFILPQVSTRHVIHKCTAYQSFKK